MLFKLGVPVLCLLLLIFISPIGGDLVTVTTAPSTGSASESSESETVTEGTNVTLTISSTGNSTNSTDSEIPFTTESRIFAGALIVIGVALCVIGYRLFKVTLAIVAFIFGFDVMLSVLYYHTHLPWWLQIGLALIVGCLFVAFVFWSFRIGLFVLGAAAGIALVAAVLSTNLMHSAWKYAVFAGVGLVTGVIAVFLERLAVICATSVLGSYLIVASLSFFVGANIHREAQDIFKASFDNLSSTVWEWLLLVAFVLIAGGGVFVQVMYTAKGWHHHHHDHDHEYEEVE